jgi:hypothetical protein
MKNMRGTFFSVVAGVQSIFMAELAEPIEWRSALAGLCDGGVIEGLLLYSADAVSEHL